MNRALLLAAAGAGAYLAYRALKPRYDYRGKHAVITGGSRGLGLVLARQLADAGARVSLCARGTDELSRAADDVGRRGPGVFTHPCDVTDRAQVEQFLDAARQNFGPVDVLINNAGVIGVGPLETATVAEFEESLKTHFWACLYTCSSVTPEMTRRGNGRIINIASLGGKTAIPHMLPYVVGKHALVGFSTGLRAELARYGVVVTTVSPGILRTGSHLHAQFKGRHEEEFAWFASSSGVPGFTISAESAASSILSAAALGDAELVLTLPAKAQVMFQALMPNLAAEVNALANQYLLPEPGGVGTQRVAGADSRGKESKVLTLLADSAARRNNEVPAGPVVD